MSQDVYKKLKPLQIEAVKLFVDKGLNQSEISRVLQPTQKTINRWFQKPYFIEAIECRKKELLTIIKQDELSLIKHLKAMVYYDIGEIFDKNGRLRLPKDMPDDLRAALSSIQTKTYWEGKGEDAEEVTVNKYKCADKLAAIRLLGEWMNVFKTKLDINHSGAIAGIDLSGMSIEEIQAEKEKLNALRG